MENKTVVKPTGRKALTDVEKEKRNSFLANEKPTDRTKRVLNPRLKRIISQMDALISAVKSPRYVFEEEQKTKILETIAERYDQLANSFNTGKQKEIENIL